MKPLPRRSSRRIHVAALVLLLGASACALFAEPTPAPAPEPEAAAPSLEPAPEVYRRADAARVQQLEQEIARLRADLEAAEQTLVAVESGLSGSQTRAEAVSLIAEGRIQLERSEGRAPWRRQLLAEARAKLDEADRQLELEHIGSAIFFASRATRIATNVAAEADRVAKAKDARRVKGDRVNLRARPDRESEVRAVLPDGLPIFPEGSSGEWTLVRTVGGDLGWIRSDLLR